MSTCNITQLAPIRTLVKSAILEPYSRTGNIPAPMNAPVLEINNLVCRKGHNLLFNPVSFQVRSGELIQVRGANGSGKSTLLRALCDFHSAEFGTIRWHFEQVGAEAVSLGSQMIYLGHKSGLNSVLSGRENLMYMASLLGNVSYSAIDHSLAHLGAERYADLAVSKLSAGQRQTISLCRLTLSDRQIWLLDEPATALDQKMISKFEALCQRHLSKGNLIVYTSHQSLENIKNSQTILLEPFTNAERN